MDTDEAGALPFQLQFDKPLASKVEIAAWNPEKDLLAMVTEDSKILLHRFNWQRLWTVSPGKRVTSICWRPDGKALAVGTEDGAISLHDVENGRLLRSLKLHTVAVICLNWEEDRLNTRDHFGSLSLYEDRTSRFFPPSPRVPRMPGVVSGDSGFSDDSEDSFQELSNSSQHRFNILCSGDREGNICFSIFGIFPIAKVNIHDFHVPTLPMAKEVATRRILDASVYKVAMSKDLCHLIVVCSGRPVEDKTESRDIEMAGDDIHGLHCLVLDTSIFWKRKNELHQVAQHASSIEDLAEVIRASISVMSKQWSDAMRTFNEKFSSLSSLINDHGMDSNPQEEFLSLLGGARTSPPIHQFLVNSLGEAGMKRVSKVICNAGKELQLIVLDHLQPAAEIIAFRMGELRGLSRWRARYQGIGLDENLIHCATEKSGMLLVQIERFTRVLCSAVQQFSNFFSWIHKSIKLFMAEPSDQLPPYNSELVVIFLKFLYDQDPVRVLLEISEIDDTVEVDSETMQIIKDLVQFGGFSDREYLRRTLAKEFQQMESSFKEALLMPFSTISRKIFCENFLPLFPLPSAAKAGFFDIPISVSFYEDASEGVLSDVASQHEYLDYMSFQIPDEVSRVGNCIGIVRGLIHGLSSLRKCHNKLEAVLLCTPTSYQCVDMSLYKDTQLVLLLNETISTSESSGDGCMMLLDVKNLPFASISGSSSLDYWQVHQLKDSISCLQMEDERVRKITHMLVKPLAVSASRGVACVFGSKKRALVYILEEDEDEMSDGE